MSNSSELRVSIVEESTPGVTPASPSFLVLPTTGQNLQPLLRYLESQTLAPGRNVADVVRATNSSGGQIPCELRWGDMSEAVGQLMRAVMCATEDAAVSQTTLSLISGGLKSIVGASAGDLPQASWKIGDVVKVTAATDPFDLGYARITDNTFNPGQAITVDKAFVGAIATASATRGARMQNGATHRHFTIEIARTDINKAIIFRKQVVNTLDLEISTGAISKANFGFVGGNVQFVDSPVSGTGQSAIYLAGATYSVPPARTVMDAVSVPLVHVAGAEYECSSIRINIDNKAQPREIIGPTGSSVGTIRRGQFNVTGSFQWYYDGSTEQAKFVSNTPTDFVVVIEDEAGKAWSLSIARAKWSAVRADTSGPDTDDFFNGDFRAIVDATNSWTMRLQRWS